MISNYQRVIELLREHAADLQLCHCVDDDWRSEQDAKAAHDELLELALWLERSGAQGEPAARCGDCPPDDYPTDATRCAPCDRRSAPAQQGEPVAWLKDDGSDAWTDVKKRKVPQYAGTAGKILAGRYSLPLFAHPAPAQQPGLLDDESLARQIGEIGNQVHNLGCEHQNNEALADRLAEIAHQAWILQRSAMISKQQQSAPPIPEAVRELLSGIRTINRATQHLVEVEGDDEPCYYQRSEWIKWMLELADKAEHAISTGQQPAPKGKNSHGLDAHYFHEKLSQIVRSIDNLTPAEMARALARYVVVADEAVLREPEFQQHQQAALPTDDFHGDNEALLRSIDALLNLDARDALAPHGIGGHARTLLSAAAARLSPPEGAAACTQCGKLTTAHSIESHRCWDCVHGAGTLAVEDDA